MHRKHDIPFFFFLLCNECGFAGVGNFIKNKQIVFIKVTFLQLNTILEVQPLAQGHLSLINCPLVDSFDITRLSTRTGLVFTVLPQLLLIALSWCLSCRGITNYMVGVNICRALSP